MDATKAIVFLTARANSEAAAAEKARERLIKGCEVVGSSLDHLMDAVLVADAMAKPWAELMVRIERHGVREGLAKQIQKVTEALVNYGIALSTSMVTNAARLHEQDGLRRFLSLAQSMDIEDDAPAEEQAPAAEPEPEPAAVQVPKATPAQKRTLAAIRDNGVKLRESRVGQTQVSVECGEKPRKDMVEWVISQGWAKQDASRSLFHGQAVSLTEIGEAILAI
ncbi:hypothetical protein [Streptomyces milbemycinicus]|uniref:hypothetical protein n=1 Tax=Streptomyces milbemycinicus TaxID=476552 RepID=UPI000A367693|nr:hypothetical protein [Streptomyces milbemycinicus]